MDADTLDDAGSGEYLVLKAIDRLGSVEDEYEINRYLGWKDVREIRPYLKRLFEARLVDQQ